MHKVDKPADSGPPASAEREIFLSALELASGPERDAFLRKACAGDPGLELRVRDLLKEQEQVGDFLKSPACTPTPRVGPHGTEVVPSVTEEVGDKIGRYKLLQRIGEGGCGAVYMAQQEEPIQRRVALKIIKLGMDTRQVIARFEAERQALALMDHTNIAKVLDAGATSTGRPYFVMELVRGIKITEYCDQNNLSTSERLELFISVCHAIQHAHQKGIIHRDIKPSNVMVTLHDGTPVPKVIDFGVAKAINQQRLTNKTVFTAFEQFIGTPAYMSPEQAEMSGLDIDTRSDIYSLGVLLYELLTGKTPFDADTLVQKGIDECRRTIRLDEPSRPSGRLQDLQELELTTTADRRRSRGPELIRLLKGDLDWIVMKCLEKDRTRRYETVNALATEVRNYLQGEPVSARPPSGLYRFQKFARRNKTALATSAGIALILLVGAGLSTWLAIRATRAEHETNMAHRQEVLLRRQAENGWERAREHAARIRLNEYVADMNLAHQSLLAGNYGRTVQLLEKHIPQAGQVDLRGFEWRFLWQLSQGDYHNALPTQESAVQSIAFSPKGDMLATALRDGTKVWSLTTRTPVVELNGSFPMVAFSPSGDVLYAGGPGGVRKWNTTGWAEQALVREGINCLAVSPAGDLLAVGTRQDLLLIEAGNGSTRRVLRGASGPVAFSPDGKMLVSDSAQGLTLWATQGGERRVLENATNVFSRGGPWMRGNRLIAFSPEGHEVVAARNSRSAAGIYVLTFWDAQSGKQAGTMPDDPERVEHTGGIVGIAFSPDGKTLATGSMDHSVRLWDMTTRRRKQTLQGHLNEVWALAFSPDGQTVATGAKDGGIKLWPAHPIPKEDSVKGAWQPLAYSPDGKMIAGFEFPRTIVLLKASTFEQTQELQLEQQRFRPPGSISISHDLKTVAEGLETGVVQLSNLQTHDTARIKASEMPIGLVSLSADGHELITGGFGQPARWWDLAAGTSIQLSNEVHKALFSADNRSLVLFARNNTVQIWDVGSHRLRRSLPTDAPTGFSAVLSPDGKILATASSPADLDSEILLWDVFTGKQVGSCIGHKQMVFALAFSPDGRTLASSSDDSTMRFWNVATCQELMSIRRLGNLPRALLFSPDNRGLITSSGGRPNEPGTLQIYKLPLLSEIDKQTPPPSKRG